MSQQKYTDEVQKGLRTQNLYQLLQLKKSASDAEIRRSYKKMALKFHPDKNSAAGSKEVFGKVSDAYDTLSNPQKRAQYDQKFNLINRPKVNPSAGYSKNAFSPFDMDTRFYQREKEEFERVFRKRHSQNSFDDQARKERQSQQSEQRCKGNGPTFSNFKNAKKDPNVFTANKKSDFGKKVSNRPTYTQYSNDVEKKIRQQKENERLANKSRQVKLVVGVIVFWLFLEVISPWMKGTPVYSFKQSSSHPIQHNTALLNTTFYVNDIYFDRAGADSTFQKRLDKKVDFLYLKSLSRVCSSMVEKQETLEFKLSKVKSKKSKRKLEMQLQQIDKEPCFLLHGARELNPQYFQTLFSEGTQDPSQL